MFDSVDADRSEELELNELKKLLKRLLAVAKSADGGQAVADEKARRLRAVAAVYETAHEVTLTLEEGEALRERMRPNGAERSAGVRLGTILSSKGIKIGDVVNTWDKDGGGTVELAEFRTRTKELGLIVDKPSDLDDLFKSRDTDGSGTLELEELKKMLQELQIKAKEADAQEKAQAEKVKSELKPAAR